MSLSGTLEADIDIKASSDRFYKALSNELHKLLDASDNVHAVDVHHGDWTTPGSIKLWKYTIDGKQEEIKEKVEFEDEKRRVVFEAVEGHVLEVYNKYKLIFDVNDGLVKLRVEYEKRNQTDEAPNNYLNFLVGLVKDLDAHILKNA